MPEGLTTTNVPSVSLLDEIIGNRAGSSARSSVAAFAAQLLAVGNFLDPDDLLPADGRIAALESALAALSLTGDSYWRDTKALLLAVAGMATGDTGWVLADAVTANNGIYRYASSAWTKTAELPANFGRNVLAFSGVAGTGTTYTATALIPRTQVEDGNRRLFSFVPHVNSVPDVDGRVYLALSDDVGSPNLIRFADDVNIKAGTLKAGQRYLLLADGARYYLVGKSSADADMPQAAVVAAAVNGAASAASARRLIQPQLSGPLVPGDLDTIILPNTAAVQTIDASFSGKVVLAQFAALEVDLEWLHAGTRTTFIVKNAANTAKLRLRLPPGCTVLGDAPQTGFLEAASGTVFSISRARNGDGSLDLIAVQTVAGSVIAAVSQADKARVCSIIMGGQSLASRAVQGYWPSAFEARRGATRIINAAVGASSLFYANALAGYNWWDERFDAPGPLAIAAVAMISASLASKPVGEPDPQILFFNIGQNDADNLESTGTTTMATVRDRYRKIAAYIRTNTGLNSLIMAIDLLGADDGGAYTDGQCSAFRRAQLAACKDDVGVDDPLIRPGIETFDLARNWDDVHLALGAQPMQAARHADLFDELVNAVAVPARQGIKIISHTVTGTTQHDLLLEASPGYGLLRDLVLLPLGIDLLASAVPAKTDVPFVISSWSWIGAVPLNQITLRLVTDADSSAAVPVTNWGVGRVSAATGRLVRDVLTGRAWRTYDPRPLV